MAVVGLGYVGLPVALEFADHFSVVGFDINKQRVDMMKQGVDPSCELESSAFQDRTISFTCTTADLKAAKFFVVAVPTPIDSFNQPNLKALKAATKTVATVLKKGDYVVFESTVYPGCTEEVCVPILEEISGLTFNEDFKVGYSPERINPGDKKNTIDKIVKIVSGSDEEALDVVANVYATIITAGVHKAPSLKVAEAAKIVENTQRDVNIALMNELSMIFEKIGINTYDVLQAAGTKWNFLNFYPGLVGGHCIGVDPYYLIQKAIRVGHNPILITAGRRVNDGMPAKISEQIAAALREQGKTIRQCRILVKGITFKENVTDIRNSKAAALTIELCQTGAQVDVIDPLADPKEVDHEYGLNLKRRAEGPYDAIVIAVSHKQFMKTNGDTYRSLGTDHPVVFDIKGIIKEEDHSGMKYLSL
ncbi:MAG: nucleotide sugar dehydrogenase [Bacteroidota bacterium]